MNYDLRVIEYIKRKRINLDNVTIRECGLDKIFSEVQDNSTHMYQFVVVDDLLVNLTV
jgi:hypothetical protein